MRSGRLTFLAGLIAGVAITLGVVVGGQRVMAWQASKYSVTTVFENERVRVRDVTFPPGVLDTGMHTHEYAHVGVILTEGSLRFTEPGGGQPEEVTFSSGSVGFRGPNATHMVANPGDKPMRVIEVELK